MHCAQEWSPIHEHNFALYVERPDESILNTPMFIVVSMDVEIYLDDNV